ncbi:Hypothetical protein I5071_75220 [Sandaracinus amylolyticus]|nr:Hypothetical protein I5071_75220 [Sandaracinus amylolyticus]
MVCARMQRFFVSDVHDASAPPDDPHAAYCVAWRINPHMQVGSTSLDRARAQHETLVRALVASGADVRRHPFVRGCFDCVFAKDNAVLARTARGRRALLCRPRHAVRAREQAARARSLARHGYQVDRARHHLEGGDVVRAGGALVLGHGFRSEPAAARELAAWSGLEVLALELVDAHLYHLDTALAALPDGTLLVCPDALAPPSLRALRRWRRARRVVEVARDEALRFGLNLVTIGRRVILAKGAPGVERALASLGYEPLALELDEFHRAGGSAACLVSEEHRFEAARSSDAA